jgi:hypothetical protein
MIRYMALLGVCSLLFFCLVDKSLGQDQDCTVRIVSPRNDDKVAEVDQVTGTGTIPPGTYLWVLAHRQGLALWWPEGAGPATITKGSWNVTATFGVERDNGRRFEVSAAVVDRTTNEKLVGWVKKTNETGQYPGIDYPATVKGCAPDQVTVTKSN